MPSTVISTFTYNDSSSSLIITFTSGIVYEYKAVPVEVYEAMKASFAKGIFFNEQVKGKYECERLNNK
jgi:hypothetical protein